MIQNLPQVAESKLNGRVCFFVEHFTRVWNRTSADFPSFNQSFSVEEQLQNEIKVSEAFEKAFSQSAGMNDVPDIDVLHAAKMKALVKVSLAELFRHKQSTQKDEFLDKCFSCAIDFARQSKQFDPLLTGEEIYQALRNIWIINSLQLYLQRPVTVTPSAFAYSLLYPYTDGYLDDPDISFAEKENFISCVEDMLMGDHSRARGMNLKRISYLISLVEKEYPRKNYPLVYESLLEIHRAQERSLDEHHEMYSPETIDLLDISFDKGGTSVLADAYLTAGKISDDVAEFAFGLGAILQLIDDFQDIASDSKNKQHTIFTEAADRQVLERETNRLFNFTAWLGCAERIFPSEDAKALSELSLMSCKMLMFEAIARESSFYSNSYIRMLEPYSPLRFEYLRSVKSKLDKKLGEDKLKIKHEMHETFCP